MEKVYLALKMVELMAEKTKLENDCREGASQLKIMDVKGNRRRAPRSYWGDKAAVMPVCVFPQQKCSQLEQRKVQLMEQCKGHRKRAMSICKMQDEDYLPEDLRNVRVDAFTH